MAIKNIKHHFDYKKLIDGTYPCRKIIMVIHDMREKASYETLQIPTKVFRIAALSR